MGRYIVRRLIEAFVITLIISAVTFVVVRASSDPMAQYSNNKNISAEDKARIAKSLGLDQPLYNRLKVDGISTKVQGPKVSPIGDIYWNSYDWTVSK